MATSAAAPTRVVIAEGSGLETSTARGRGRGRGRARGRSSYSRRGYGGNPGRGRGRGRDNDSGGSQTQTDPTTTSQMTPVAAPRLTHFLSLPIGHHTALRTRVSAFTSTLQNIQPPIVGLDDSIIIAPRRLHLTLGVMSLASETPNPRPSGVTTQPSSTLPQRTSALPALSGASDLLRALKPRVLHMLDGASLRVPLTHIDIMKPERGDASRAHVLWAGPSPHGQLYAEERAEFNRLRDVAEMLKNEFVNAGFMVDERRPLKLHATLVNTTYRRPRPKGARIPFNYEAIVKNLSERIATPSSDTTGDRNSGKINTQPVRVDLGTWNVDEVQICEMGSYGPEGEYVCVARIDI